MDSGVELVYEGLIKVLMEVDVLEDTKLLTHVQGLSKIITVILNVFSVDAELLHNLVLELREHLTVDPLLELSVEEGILVPSILSGSIRVHPPFFNELSWGHLC